MCFEGLIGATLGLVDTLELLTTAVLGVFVAVNEMLGEVPVGERLNTLANESARLSASKKAEREREALGRIRRPDAA
jgi:hypothetical protein